MTLNLGAKAGKVVALSAVATAAFSLLGTQVASAVGPTSPAGAFTLTDSSSVPLVSGTQYGSAFNFTGTLPANPGDECPGDTSTGGYLVYSYIVADGTSNGAAPGALTVTGGQIGPIGSLDTNKKKQWAAINTAVGTGEVTGIPAFYFSNLAGSLGTTITADTTYDVGIACVNTNAGNTVAKYWNQQINFTADSSDAGGFTWALGPAAPAPNTPESPLAVGLPLSAVAIAGASVVVLRRRRKHVDPVA